MLIKSLSLKDFKCFEQVDIDFGKITLLTGANSSGKSSLIYALLGIMQSKYFPQYFALNGELIKMGGFEDIIRKKASKEQFGIGISLDNNGDSGKIYTEWIEELNSQQPQLIYYKSNKGIIQKNSDGTNSVNIHFDSDIFRYGKNWRERIIKMNPEIKIITDSDIYENNGSIVKGILSQSIDNFVNESSYFSQFLMEYGDESFNYIGSFRLPPERTYYRKPNASKIGVNGEGYIDQIIEWEESDKEKYNELIEAVTEMGLFKTIKANKMKGGRFELNVQVNENSELASLTDVGFGISQFLPIIVADLQMEDGSCLAISQPEIHLHPKIQATLGDYFCKQVNNTDKQYIVETHSEYLINRMRLLIVKGELKPEDVKLYYMENDGIKTTTYAIELTTDGQIKNAPQGFFDTYEMDVMDIALYASA